ncbi:MAG: 3-methyl-2-oxobutanoate hydroxymethyltransferase [Myxococcales bacterium]|jgi:3-methyl-2-oxobutanoate hydroxymethyltransferase|nr:3-methyl-2-oxobutanoate hydroxymethyltransferase [Myxococcales bacterium]
MQPKKKTAIALRKMKSAGERIAMMTAYDAAFARALDEAGLDALLVGDSLGMAVRGERDTLNVTLDEIAYHCRMVARATRHAHVVCDLPFLSYQISAEEAVRSAGLLVAKGGAESVKLEGGAEYAKEIARIVRAGIPVMGHIGLTPQSVNLLGGYGVQGRDEATAQKLMSDALSLQDAGCYALVLEMIPHELATHITASLEIPTIGIGAGVGCDGQVLVCYDALGMNPDFTPRFLKRYAELYAEIGQAVRTYATEVKSGAFPDEVHSFATKPVQLAPAASASPEAAKVYGATGS